MNHTPLCRCSLSNLQTTDQLNGYVLKGYPKWEMGRNVGTELDQQSVQTHLQLERQIFAFY